MKSPPKFKLFVPSGYADQYPDITISGNTDHGSKLPIIREDGAASVGSRLPEDIEQLIFTYGRELPHNYKDRAVPNFIHRKNYFVVSRTVKDFFVSIFLTDVQIARINLSCKPEVEREDAYFAIKVLKKIDCVDLTQSFKLDFLFRPPRLTPFLDLKEKLAEGVQYGIKTYGYPYWPQIYTIDRIQLLGDRIPSDAQLFEPEFMPGHLICSTDFAQKLNRVCVGGNMGYYFWTLDLDRVTESYHETMMHMR